MPARTIGRGDGAPKTPHVGSWGPRTIRLVLLFVASVLVANALVGERGLIARLRAGREHAALAASVAALTRENTLLRDEVRRLREDVRTIEALARRGLGMRRPDETVFVISDVTGAEPLGRR